VKASLKLCFCHRQHPLIGEHRFVPVAAMLAEVVEVKSKAVVVGVTSGAQVVEVPLKTE